MSDYATSVDTPHPIMNPVLYWRATAFGLTAVALLGIVLSVANQEDLLGSFLTFDWTHNVLHVVLALAAFMFGFANLPAKIVKVFALVFGVIYAGLGILGFFTDEVATIGLEIGENLVHLLIGAWGIISGLAKN